MSSAATKIKVQAWHVAQEEAGKIPPSSFLFMASGAMGEAMQSDVLRHATGERARKLETFNGDQA